jgi:putative membrane protein
MMGSESMFFGSGFMWIFWLLLIVVIIVLFKIFTRTDSRSNNSAEDSPLEILKKRYARGDINEEQFKRRRKELDE